MIFKSKKHAFIVIVKSIVIILIGMTVYRAIKISGCDHYRLFPFIKETYKPGDIRIRSTRNYVDVISVEAETNGPDQQYERKPISDLALPQTVKLTNEDFTKMARKIFEEEFRKKFGDSGVIFAKEGDSYTFDTNPFMKKYVLSLQRNEDGKIFVQVADFQTRFSESFHIVYGSPHFDKEIQAYRHDYPTDVSKRKMKDSLFEPQTGVLGERRDESFIPSDNQEEFIHQVEISARGALFRAAGNIKPEADVARKYTAILLDSLKESEPQSNGPE